MKFYEKIHFFGLFNEILTESILNRRVLSRTGNMILDSFLHVFRTYSKHYSLQMV
jgi:hypothetical protein